MSVVYQFVCTPIAVFLAGYLLLRLLGKKAVAEMTSFELLIVLILGNSISEPIVTKRLEVAIWYSFAVVLVYLVLLRLELVKPFKKWLSSSPTVLIRGGDIDEQGLKHAKLSVEQLIQQLRIKGYENCADISLCLMEGSGHISVIPKAAKRPVQPADLQLSPPPTFIPVPLIIDGSLVEQNLQYLHKTKNWLAQQLQAHGHTIQNMSGITLATYNQDGNLNLDTTALSQIGGAANYKPGDDNRE
ncbi:DUF421 domain-containing protein [Paenibacillus sp. IB182496]|uniref:DUF421 domain-containing protein n=1 Tax=Paenibacillus sabuli TaxID=2772509 RepID=A0A927BTQ7_9BACL|nr:DUF421 domain-containing protein [Paenibacillus sabuli]MBD2845359.1 DUF421 domain-containing protein [Paenibacillus sabuli]